MKRKIFLCTLLLLAVVLSTGASKQSDELKRMGIFISNFTETTMYEFDINELSDEELIRFGIGHNVINNPKSTVKKCTRKNCQYGSSVMPKEAVAASVKKYFDLDVEHQSILDDDDEGIYFDGKNYHFNPEDYGGGVIYYAEVQNVRRGKNNITMEGELYNTKNKKDRPGFFVAKAKPHKYNGKNTWAILSLSVEWNEDNDYEE